MLLITKLLHITVSGNWVTTSILPVFTIGPSTSWNHLSTPSPHVPIVKARKCFLQAPVWARISCSCNPHQCQVLFEFRELCSVALIEPWLHLHFLSSFCLIQAGNNVRGIRQLLIQYVSVRRCRWSEREQTCTLDTELLCLSLQPFYLQREFGSIIICLHPPKWDHYKGCQNWLPECNKKLAYDERKIAEILVLEWTLIFIFLKNIINWGILDKLYKCNIGKVKRADIL